MSCIYNYSSNLSLLRFARSASVNRSEGPATTDMATSEQ